MKTKKVAHFDVGKILAIAEHGLLQLWIQSEKKLDQWFDNTPKIKRKAKQKKSQKSDKVLVEEIQQDRAVEREIVLHKMNQRLSELEAQKNTQQNENSIDINY